MKLTKALAPLIALALVFASCSSKTESSDDTTPATTAAPAEEGPTTTEAAEDGGADGLVPADGVKIDKEIDYGGWTITFEELTSNEDEKDEDSAFDTTTELEVSVKYTNLLDDSATPNFDVVLEIEDEDETVENVNLSNADVKEVPGDGNGKGSFTFNLDEDQAKIFDLDRATIVVGRDGYAQARVPLSDDGDLVTLKPQEQKPGLEDFEIGEMKIETVATELRWTGIINRDVIDKDETWLAMTFDIHLGENKGRPDDLEWSAALPDGTTITSTTTERVDGRYSFDYSDPGTTIKGVIVWFRLDDPVDGEYEIKVAGDVGPDGAAVSKTQKIELKATAGDAPTDAADDADADDSDADAKDAKSKDDESDAKDSDRSAKDD